jgi:hypothetical protein
LEECEQIKGKGELWAREMLGCWPIQVQDASKMAIAIFPLFQPMVIQSG